MNDIQQAKEWAESRANGNYALGEETRAVVKVIQSLPDHWIDAEKVREVLDRWAENPFPTSDEVAVLNDFEALLTPSLPTLAELTEQGNDPQQYQWMQAKIFEHASTIGIITCIDRYQNHSTVLFSDGVARLVDNRQITPLPDESKLEWPGSHADTITAESVEDVCNCRDCNSEESSLPRPEDVPPGKAWLVKFDGYEWVGTRESRVETVCSWTLARLDGADYTVARDDEITLVSRLVPEVKP